MFNDVNTLDVIFFIITISCRNSNFKIEETVNRKQKTSEKKKNSYTVFKEFLVFDYCFFLSGVVVPKVSVAKK